MVVSIRTLGELAIYHDGEPVALPPSKRTRALLAYLAMTVRPHRRDRLCEIFWEIPDDPRGTLRWSLSKLRPLVNEPNNERLVADRERVTLLTEDVEIDIKCIGEQVKDTELSAEVLKHICEQLNEPFLDGIDLPEQQLFQQWLTSERIEIDRLRGKLASRLSVHPDLSPLDKLRWTQIWEEIDPFNPSAATQLLSQMEQYGQGQEAAVLQRKLSARFRNAGIKWIPNPSTSPPTEIKPEEEPRLEKTEPRELLMRQKIQFCTAKDRSRIAYATVGEGNTIVKAANWLSHLEHDWDSPIWSPLFRELALNHQFIRYDERGNGLSDWDVTDLSFDAFVTDLETVVDACNVEQFTLLGISQGAAVSIEYAVRHPERVKHLVLFGGYAAGWRIGTTHATQKEREAVITLTQAGWGQDNPAYRQIFSSTFMPSASPSELAWFNKFQRLTTSPENAARFLNVFGDIDVRNLLKQVSVPTLVIHSLGDQRIPVETARDIAASIPGAQFVGLESDGHLLLGREPASKDFIMSVREFISAA